MVRERNSCDLNEVFVGMNIELELDIEVRFRGTATSGVGCVKLISDAACGGQSRPTTQHMHAGMDQFALLLAV